MVAAIAGAVCVCVCVCVCACMCVHVCVCTHKRSYVIAYYNCKIGALLSGLNVI